MRLIRIFFVHPTPALRPVVQAAAGRAFPGAELVEVRTVAEALAHGAHGHRELVILAEPEAEATASAVQATEASGLPRWAVVLLGAEGTDLAEAVPPEEWQAPLLARAFRSALLQHELWSENMRLQGDLRTVARRIRHDLGAPIGCIHTSAHVVKLSLSPVALRSITGMLQNIEESSLEIAQIVERVSLVLRASADPIAPARCEMGGVVAGVLRELEPALRQGGAILVPPATWPVVPGVASLLHVVWWNLIHNALRHGGPAPQIRLNWAEEAGGWRFAVHNRGPAIDPVIRAGLFRPFDQLHALPAPGLGLSIVERLVGLHGGRCGYERSDDGWAVFFFRLPGGTS